MIKKITLNVLLPIAKVLCFLSIYQRWRQHHHLNCLHCWDCLHSSWVHADSISDLSLRNTAIASRQISRRRSTNPLCNKYSEPPGHEDSPGTTFYIMIFLTYSKNWANRDWVIGFLGYFWWLMRSYIAKTEIFRIWVFWVISMHSITLFVMIYILGV